LIGVSEGAPMCALFAATYPERTRALVLLGGYARRRYAPDYPWGRTEAEAERWLAEIADSWGGPVGLELRAPSVVGDERFREWWAAYLRASASPGAAVALTKMNFEIDVRAVLPAIRVPTLVMHAARDRTLSAEQGRYLAEHIAGARYVELDSQDHLPWVMDSEAVTSEVEEFLTGQRPVGEADRLLATVLFTDMVASTDRAAELGDRRWRDVIETHEKIARREIDRYRGHLVKSTGDGFLATFDGPARAIRCARAMVDALDAVGIAIRAGLHTGECEMIDGDVGGIAVHTGARVSALAGPGEVLVSNTVKDLVAGSGIAFADRGARQLKGVPGEWRIYAVERV
jgi:class 3 adenylate cyclase